MPGTAPPPDAPTANSGDSLPAQENRMLGILLRLGSVFFISLMLAMVKMAEREGVHVVESLFWRQLAGLPIVLLWLKLTGSMGSVGTSKPWLHASRMVVGLSAMALNYWAITLLPLAEATTIGFAIPIFSTILAAMLLREPTGAWRWSAVIVGFVGIVVVLRPGADLDTLGAVVALAGALGTASVTIIIRQLGRTETTGAIVFWFSLTSLVPLGIAMPFVADAHAGTAWFYILLLSVAGAGGQLCLTASLKYAPVSVVLPMDYFSLFWATLYGWILFGMLPESTTWIGAPIIIAAGLIILWREHGRRQRATPAT